MNPLLLALPGGETWAAALRAHQGWAMGELLLHRLGGGGDLIWIKYLTDRSPS